MNTSVMTKLSKRLKRIVEFVPEGVVVGDVGTDHGYVPIALVETGKCKKVIAADLRKGPLERAKNHVKEYRMEDRIFLRLSDGLQGFKEGEVNCITIAGMGGSLIAEILEKGKHVLKQSPIFVLEPQSEIKKLRLYLNDLGYGIEKEDMVLEDGKFYPVFFCKRQKEGFREAYTDAQALYGKRLLEQQHPVLQEFLLLEKQRKEKIIEGLETVASDKSFDRIKEVKKELSIIEEALGYYEKSGEKE